MVGLKRTNKIMEKQIWKYEIVTTNTQSLTIPYGAEILTIQDQKGTLCMWVLVDPNEEKEKRVFEVFGTGQDIHYDLGVSRKYIGTYQERAGHLIFHLFEYTGV